MEPKVVKTFNDNEWSMLFDPSNETTYTLYVTGRSMIAVYESDDSNPDFNTISMQDIDFVGGIQGTWDIAPGKYVFVKAVELEGGSLFYLPKGQQDPEQSTAVLYEELSQVAEQMNSHHQNNQDPHNTGRNYLPTNQFSTIATSSLGDTPTGKFMLDQIGIMLRELITNHTGDKDNPHELSLETFGLENVANMGPAVEESDIMQATNAEMLATIAAVHTIVASREQITADLPANIIIKSPVESLTEIEKGFYDPKTIFATLDADNVVVSPGLQVTYVRNGRVYTSSTLAETLAYAKNLISNSVDKKPGVHYLYANINADGAIESIGATYEKPTVGMYQINDVSDFIDLCTGIVKDKDGEVIQRVYISKITVNDAGIVESIVNVPRGNQFIMKTGTTVSPNNTYEFNNPFYGPIEVIPEIGINDQWCDPKWNDQVGVIANYDTGRPDKIIVQTGALGLAMPAVSSGNAFTPENLGITLTAPAPLRLIIRKVT